MRPIKKLIVLAGLAALFVPALATATPTGANIVRNPGFESPSSGPTSFTGSGGGGPSAAPDWAVFNNGNGTTTTEVVTVSPKRGGSHVMHVTTDLDSSGIVQCCYDIHLFGVGARIKVLSGAVKVCVGLLGSPPCQIMAAAPTWRNYKAYSKAGSAGNPNEIVIYSAGGAGAEFLVDDVAIRPITPRGDNV